MNLINQGGVQFLVSTIPDTGQKTTSAPAIGELLSALNAILLFNP